MNNEGEEVSTTACRRARRRARGLLVGVALDVRPRAGLDIRSVSWIRFALLSPLSSFLLSQAATAAAVTFLLGSCGSGVSAS